MSALELSETLHCNGDTLPVIIVNGRVEATTPPISASPVAAQPLGSIPWWKQRIALRVLAMSNAVYRQLLALRAICRCPGRL